MTSGRRWLRILPVPLDDSTGYGRSLHHQPSQRRMPPAFGGTVAKLKLEVEREGENS